MNREACLEERRKSLVVSDRARRERDDRQHTGEFPGLSFLC